MSLEWWFLAFDLTNVPAVFQRCPHGLNPVKEWIAMLYILTTSLPFLSPSPVDHHRHKQLVLEWLQSAGLNLMPTKCQFVGEEVEYIGHLITPDRLTTNSRIVDAVRNIPTIDILCPLSKITQPLHHLTNKGATFFWITASQQVMDTFR